MAHRLLRWFAWIAAFSVAALAFAQELTLSAKVDKTTVDAGEPVTLTLILTGALEGANLSELKLPEGFVVAAQSQSTNFSIRAGATERSMHLTYVLVPQQAGTFELGPFTVTQQKKAFQTQAIEITVKKPALPPTRSRPQGERFLL
ncbi:MAG: BatD family protein [Candidatus Omnitrophica bacterium]|nr:BatD family protein [Candidatus Omnitrophota bacterium]